MVQRFMNEDELARRLSRVEQVRFQRYQREKNFLDVNRPNRFVDVNRCKRVLFRPDENIDSWIDGELGKIAENQKNEWNFDFKTGAPAKIPNHGWNWSAFAAPPASPPVSCAVAARMDVVPPASGVLSPPQMTAAQVATLQMVANARAAAAQQIAAARAAVDRIAAARSANVGKPTPRTGAGKQSKITEYMTARKYPNMTGLKFDEIKKVVDESDSDFSDDESLPGANIADE